MLRFLVEDLVRAFLLLQLKILLQLLTLLSHWCCSCLNRRAAAGERAVSCPCYASPRLLLVLLLLQQRR